MSSQCEFCTFGPGGKYACHGTKLCYDMALWEENLMKERIAKVCTGTPKFPYNKFTIVDSIIAACQERTVLIPFRQSARSS